jgi:ABC-type nitrate/sulfonate/bicarbonate transport system permease component
MGVAPTRVASVPVKRAVAGRGIHARHLKALLGMLVMAAAALLWEAVSRLGLVTPILLPAPSSVVDTFWYLVSTGRLWGHISQSVMRVLVGFVAAIVMAVPLGLFMGRSSWVESGFYASFEILRPIPPIAWTPLAIIWFGLGTPPAVFLIFLGAYFPILLNTVSGVKGIDKRLIHFAKTLGASERVVMLEIIPVAALPSIMTGMRVGLGVGWMVVVAAEMIAASSGLGYMIMDGRFTLQTDVVIVGMLSIGFLGLAMDLLFRRLESVVLRWRRGLVVER